jgi:hypothetical protein
MEDRKSWDIKNDTILDDLVTLMGLSDEEKNALAASQAEAKTIAPQMVDAFYERLLAYENTAEYLEGKTDKLRVSLQDWFVQLFSGDYGVDYVHSRLAIGQMHVRIGLPVRYPLAMMDIILEFGEKVAAASSQAGTAKVAIRKLLAMDIAIFNQAYEDTQLKHLAETVGNERLARRLLTQ